MSLDPATSAALDEIRSALNYAGEDALDEIRYACEQLADGARLRQQEFIRARLEDERGAWSGTEGQI